MVNCNKPLSDLKNKMSKLPQSMVNVKVTNGDFDAVSNDNVRSAVSDVESRLGKNGRVLLRHSGTESVLRVMVEGEDPEIVKNLSKELSELVATEVKRIG